MLPTQPAIAGHSLPRAAKKGYVSDGLETESYENAPVAGVLSQFNAVRDM